MSDDTDENRFYDDERFHKRRPPAEPLDYSPSSGPVGAHERQMEQLQSHPYTMDNHRTTFNVSEVTEQTLYETGDGEVTWDDLNDANTEQGFHSSREANRDRGRYNDFLTMIDNLDRLSEQEKTWLHTNCIDTYIELKTTRENGLNIGNYPIEVSELAILHLVAREMVQLDSFDDRDMDNPIHNIAFNGETLALLCKQFSPRDTTITVEMVKNCRRHLTS